MFHQLRSCLVSFIVLSIVTGIIYPLTVTLIAQTCFPAQANGSIIIKNNQPVGSSLIGQEFTDPAYFWGRLSATGPVPYTAYSSEKLTGSSGSNLGPTNPVLINNIQARIDALSAADAAANYVRPANQLIPVDLVTSSASGIDPHISLASAYYQLPRVAKARNISEPSLREIITKHTTPRTIGLLGEPVVNVLEVNLELAERK